MTNTALIYDITFYQVDEEGNDILDNKGNTKIYRIKEGVRFKPLEYLVDDFDLDILEEEKWKNYLKILSHNVLFV